MCRLPPASSPSHPSKLLYQLYPSKYCSKPFRIRICFLILLNFLCLPASFPPHVPSHQELKPLPSNKHLLSTFQHHVWTYSYFGNPLNSALSPPVHLYEGNSVRGNQLLTHNCFFVFVSIKDTHCHILDGLRIGGKGVALWLSFLIHINMGKISGFLLIIISLRSHAWVIRIQATNWKGFVIIMLLGKRYIKPWPENMRDIISG